MKKMTDRELTDKISQVFEDFEDPTAEYGWLQLRKKYPERDRKAVLLWWSAAAAIFLIVCGLWFTAPVTDLTDQKIAGRPSAKLSGRTNDIDKPIQKIKGQVNRREPGDHKFRAIPQPAEMNYTKFDRPRLQREAGRNSPGPDSFPARGELSPGPPSVLSASVNIRKEPLISFSDVPKTGSGYDHPKAAEDSLTNSVDKTPSLVQTNANNSDQQATGVSSSSQKPKSGNLALSFYAGSYFNYSEGSETKINFGAGFTSDIQLGGNLMLSTGLALANNSLTYNNGVPTSKKDQRTYDLAPAPPAFGATGNNNLTTITKYDASLLVLDIPINIKYLLIPKDNKLYMLAGLSSGTYLAETYSLNYRNYSPAGAYVNQAQGAAVTKQFQAFDFARTLNVSFGYSANLSKFHNITIEPFLKYPLGGLGSEDLRFGATGINLKLNFSGKER